MIEIKNLLQYRNAGREVVTNIPDNKIIRFIAKNQGEYTYKELSQKCGVHYQRVYQAVKDYQDLLTIHRVPRGSYGHHGHFTGGKPVVLVSWRGK